MALTQVQGGMILASGKSIPKAALPTGSVLQVVSFTDGNQTTTSAGYVSTTTTASITPTSASSRIFISVALTVDTLATNVQGMTTIYKNNTTNLALGLSNDAFNDSFNTAGRLISSVSMQYLDSPATTSSTTYTVYIKGVGGSINTNVGGGSTITLMEIAT